MPSRWSWALCAVLVLSAASSWTSEASGVRRGARRGPGGSGVIVVTARSFSSFRPLDHVRLTLRGQGGYVDSGVTQGRGVVEFRHVPAGEVVLVSCDLSPVRGFKSLGPDTLRMVAGLSYLHNTYLVTRNLPIPIER